MTEREQIVELVQDGWLEVFAYDPSTYEFHSTEVAVFDIIADKLLAWHRDRMDEEDCISSCQEVGLLRKQLNDYIPKSKILDMVEVCPEAFIQHKGNPCDICHICKGKGWVSK